MNIKGTKSEENIKKAFAGESQARNKYTFYAEQAKREGNKEISELFERMAKNELMHAKIWFKCLNQIGSSEQNIMDASKGESYEWKMMYPEFAKQAREEGLEELAQMFERVAEIEKTHDVAFLEALAKIKGTREEREEASRPVYRCMFCGKESQSRLDVCPVCQAIGASELINR